MRKLCVMVLVLCGGCCSFNAQATSTALKDWTLLRPYTEAGIRASNLDDEEKQIRLDLVGDFDTLLRGMHANGE